MKKSGKILKILIILTVILIWAQSLLPPDMSSDESSFVLDKIVKPILSFIAGHEVEISEHFVRKAGHFTEFCILGILVSMYAMRENQITERPGGRKRNVQAAVPYTTGKHDRLNNCALRIAHCALFCFLIAFLDETIQIFTGRGPAILDVWIDTSGATTGIIILTLIHFIKIKRRRAPTTTHNP